MPKRYFRQLTIQAKNTPMKTEQFISTTQTTSATLPVRELSPFLQLAAAQAHRKLRIAVPLPRRQCCLTRRAMVAALREAELDEMQAAAADAA